MWLAIFLIISDGLILKRADSKLKYTSLPLKFQLN